MARAKAVIEATHYATTIEVGHHRIVADEPRSNGGADAGPDPYDLLLASLSACTAITLRMYGERKKWDLRRITVNLHFTRDAHGNERIDRVLELDGELSPEQRTRIVEIAERTPVTLTLKRGLPIVTSLASDAAGEASAREDRLDEAIEESFPASDPPSVSGKR